MICLDDTNLTEDSTFKMAPVMTFFAIGSFCLSIDNFDKMAKDHYIKAADYKKGDNSCYYYYFFFFTFFYIFIQHLTYCKYQNQTKSSNPHQQQNLHVSTILILPMVIISFNSESKKQLVVMSEGLT